MAYAQSIWYRRCQVFRRGSSLTSAARVRPLDLRKNLDTLVKINQYRIASCDHGALSLGKKGQKRDKSRTMIWYRIFGATHKIGRWNVVEGQGFSNLPVTIFGGHNEIITTKRI